MQLNKLEVQCNFTMIYIFHFIPPGAGGGDIICLNFFGGKIIQGKRGEKGEKGEERGKKEREKSIRGRFDKSAKRCI